MSHRRLVAPALREELAEYSSLLRALRTSQTLDITTHLTQPNDSNDDQSDPPEQEENSQTQTAGASSQTQSRSPSQLDPPHWKKRDQWTRWPLLAKDVPQPEWSLQDEVGTMVKRFLASINPEFDSGPQSDSDGEDEGDSASEDEEAYLQTLAQLVTPVIENHLESLFALISTHTIARSDSMQNRIEPFDWRDLVNILTSPVAHHLVDQTILQNLISRMQAICSVTPASASSSVPLPSPDSALHRYHLMTASRSRLNHMLSRHTSSLFQQALPPHYNYLTTNEIKGSNTKRKKKGGTTIKTRESGNLKHQTSEVGDRDELKELEAQNDQEDSESISDSGTEPDDEMMDG